LATLVGDHTYGKASVQNIIPLPGRTSAKVTIAHYGLPSGTAIARKVDEDGAYISGGIKPDVEVKLSNDPNVALGDLKTDNQLQKAVEIIRQKNPKARAPLTGHASLTLIGLDLA
jgi:carboxyl-terminal processing protease